MPYRPVSTVSGMKIVAMTVRTFITLVQPIRTWRQVRVEQARDPILQEHRFVSQPDQVVVDVAEPVRHGLGDLRELAARRAGSIASRCGSTTRRSDEMSRLKSRICFGEVAAARAEHLGLELLEPVLQLVDLRAVVVDHRVDDPVQQRAGAFAEHAAVP